MFLLSGSLGGTLSCLARSDGSSCSPGTRPESKSRTRWERRNPPPAFKSRTLPSLRLSERCPGHDPGPSGSPEVPRSPLRPIVQNPKTSDPLRPLTDETHRRTPRTLHRKKLIFPCLQRTGKSKLGVLGHPIFTFSTNGDKMSTLLSKFLFLPKWTPVGPSFSFTVVSVVETLTPTSYTPLK